MTTQVLCSNVSTPNDDVTSSIPSPIFDGLQTDGAPRSAADAIDDDDPSTTTMADKVRRRTQ